MHTSIGLVACVVMAVTVAACDPVADRRYTNEGAGVDLYTSDRLSQIELQKQYVDYICNFPGVTCAGDWTTFVRAGMNDIDQRCDGFLTWLDARRRDKEPVLAELSAINTAVHSVMTVTGSSPRSLDILTAAFGLATATYNNWSSRLLISVNQSTVQQIVYKGQGDFRTEIKGRRVADLPEAIYLLRNYLRLCMPITIEASINTTTMLVLNDAPDAARESLVVANVVTNAPPARAARADDPAGQSTRRNIPTVTEFNEFILNYTANEFPPSTVKRLQDALCVPVGEVGTLGKTTKDHIAIFEATDMREASDNSFILRDNKIDVNERVVLLKHRECPRDKFQNFYERITFEEAANVTERVDRFVIDRLNKVKLPGLSDLPKGTTLNDARARIKLVRASLMKSADTAKQLRPLPDRMAGQWTRDLFDLLSRLPAQ